MKVPGSAVQIHVPFRYVVPYVLVALAVGALAGWFVRGSGSTSQPAAAMPPIGSSLRSASPVDDNEFSPALAASTPTCVKGSFYIRLSTSPPDRYAAFDASRKLVEIRSRMTTDDVSLPSGVATGYTAVPAVPCPRLVRGLQKASDIVWAGAFRTQSEAYAFCRDLGLSPTGKGQWDCLPIHLAG